MEVNKQGMQSPASLVMLSHILEHVQTLIPRPRILDIIYNKYHTTNDYKRMRRGGQRREKVAVIYYRIPSRYY